MKTSLTAAYWYHVLFSAANTLWIVSAVSIWASHDRAALSVLLQSPTAIGLFLLLLVAFYPDRHDCRYLSRLWLSLRVTGIALLLLNIVIDTVSVCQDRGDFSIVYVVVDTFLLAEALGTSIGTIGASLCTPKIHQSVASALPHVELMRRIDILRRRA